MADDSIIQKIQKLLNMTVENGCTPAEAAHAAAKATEFMQRHGLSLFDVEAKTYGEQVTQEHRDLEWERLPSWVYSMAGAVARPNGCDYVVSQRREQRRDAHGWAVYRNSRPVIVTTNRLKFIGHTTDVKVVAYLYDTLSKALWVQSAKDCKRIGRSGASLAKARWDFMRGAASAIEERLEEENRKTEQLGQIVPVHDDGRGVEGTAPVSGQVYGAMVLVKDKAVKDYMAKEFPHVKTVSRGTSRYDQDAVRSGYAAGKAIPIRKGVEGSPQGLLR